MLAPLDSAADGRLVEYTAGPVARDAVAVTLSRPGTWCMCARIEKGGTATRSVELPLRHDKVEIDSPAGLQLTLDCDPAALASRLMELRR